MEGTAIHSHYKALDGKLREQERDIAKYWKKNGQELTDDRELDHVDEVLNLLGAMTEDKRFIRVKNGGKGQVRRMCEVVQRYIDMGIQEGEGMLASLMSRLFQLGRIEDAKRATESEEVRKILYQEFGMQK